MAYTDQEKQKWVEIAQDTGSSIERGAPVLTLGELDTTVSIPGVKFSSISYDEEGNVTGFGTPEKYAQLPLGTLAIKTRSAQDAADAANTAADAANTAAARANTASDGAEKVDAEIEGMTVTITDRNGNSSSVNIGFEIYKTYESVAAMKADAKNVPSGKFVMIATADPTSTENAQLWARNAEPATSANPFTFLSDLDQAATHAWDDWNTNLRQGVVDATNSANTAATNANNKASAANTAATNANTATTKANTATENANTATTKANTATENANTATANANAAATNANAAATNATDAKNTVTTWFSGTGNNGFKNTAETWLSTTQTTWNNWFSDSLSNGVRKLWNTFWSSINSSWNGFWGTSETDPNGVRKQWADLHSQAESDHDTATSDHTTAQSDHTTAVEDHTQASQDSSRAATDHTRADIDHSTAESDNLVASEDHTTAVADHSQASSDHSIAVTDHTTATSDHATAVSDHSTYEEDHAVSEAQQTTFEANEAQRQQDFEDAEAERMAAMVVTQCYVDTSTMSLVFVQPARDTTQYKVLNGDLNIIVTYD